MPISLISKISPKNNGSFPVIEDIDISGGYQVRENTTDRDTIPLLNRKEGMLVYVKDISKYYTLSGGLSNDYWIEKNFGGGASAGLTQVILTNEDRNIESGSNEFIIVSNTSGVTKTILLPADPVLGQELFFCTVYPGNTSIVAINANGKTIDFFSIWTMRSYYDSILHIIYNGIVWVIIYDRETD